MSLPVMFLCVTNEEYKRAPALFETSLMKLIREQFTSFRKGLVWSVITGGLNDSFYAKAKSHEMQLICLANI
jgi:hypothetical protein